MNEDDQPITRREFEQRFREAGRPPIIDPTANVLQLVEAAMTRQDDLRAAEARHRDALALLRSEMGHEIRQIEKQAQRDLAKAESGRIDALSQAESRRIDALLSAQQQNVALASARAELTATALAERVDASAKALAMSVETTAKTLTATVEAHVKALSDRIVPLEQARYQAAGSAEQRTEGRASNQWIIGLVMSAPSTFVALIALVLLLVK